MKKVLLIIIILPALTCYSQNNKVSKDGLILSAGAGNLSGGIGIIAQFQYRIDIFTFIVPHAGSGIELGTRDIEASLQGYSIGISLEHGKYHRVFGSAIYGSRGVGYENKESRIVNRHVLVGPSLLIGYKALSRSGFLFSINVGAAYVRNPVAVNKKFYSGPTAGISAGFKF